MHRAGEHHPPEVNSYLRMLARGGWRFLQRWVVSTRRSVGVLAGMGSCLRRDACYGAAMSLALSATVRFR